MSEDEDTRARYKFGPLERRGLIAGWRGGQVATVGAGLIVGVLALRANASIGGVVVALFALGASLAVSTWPFGGRTAEEWAPDAVRFAADSLRRARSGREDPFRSLRVLPIDLATSESVESKRRQAAVVVDMGTKTYTVSFRASAGGFVLLGPDEKARRVAAWASTLSSLAREGSVLHRIQWTSRNRQGVVATGDALPHSEDDYIASTNGASARRSYLALLEEAGRDASDFETVLSLSVSSVKAARAVRSAGGGDTGACALVLREAAALRRRLADAAIDAGPVLAPDHLEVFVRQCFGSVAPKAECGSRGVGWPWPMAMRPEWSRVLVEGSWHATYWIAEWPRTDVGPDFLGPILLMSEVPITMSVVMEPMGPLQAVRKLEQARTVDVADAQLRRRGGFLATARRGREEQVVARREVELADGHAPYRFSGYVTVRAPSSDDLDDACAQAEQAAARCGLELRLCYGDQGHAFTTALPLCRGLS